MSHARDFGLESGNEAIANQLVFDYRSSQLSEIDQALCDYAIRLTLRPDQMNRADVECLRQLGLNDHQITVATQVIAYFNYINRIADGLGVDPEPWMTLDPARWKAEKPDWRVILANT